MLGYKYRVSLHRCLLAVILNDCRCFALCYEIYGVLSDDIHAFIVYVVDISLLQMKATPEFGITQPLKKL
jgi:hypothetical protein